VAPGVQRRVFVRNHQGKSSAVGNRQPGVFVVEIQDRFQQRTDQRQAFPAAIEAANIFSSDVGDGWIPRRKSGAVFHDQDILAGAQVSDAATREIESDPV